MSYSTKNEWVFPKYGILIIKLDNRVKLTGFNEGKNILVLRGAKVQTQAKCSSRCSKSDRNVTPVGWSTIAHNYQAGEIRRGKSFQLLFSRSQKVTQHIMVKFQEEIRGAEKNAWLRN